MSRPRSPRNQEVLDTYKDTYIGMYHRGIKDRDIMVLLGLTWPEVNALRNTLYRMGLLDSSKIEPWEVETEYSGPPTPMVDWSTLDRIQVMQDHMDKKRQQLVQTVLELRKRGLSIRVIAGKTYISPSDVKHILKEAL